MKFGMRKPSIRKSIAARTSVKDIYVTLRLESSKRHGLAYEPQKAAYNRIYNKPLLVYLIFSRFLNISK